MTITTRAGKGSALTSTEHDNNLAALQIDAFTGHIETVADKTYYIDLKAPAAYTINSLTRRVMTSGSCTLAVQIDGVNVTSLSALSATTSEVETSASGANSVAAGNTVTLIASSNSSALDLAFTLSITLV